MPLYKYLKPVHALLALKLGVVRISTLAEFRGDEIDDARKDGTEGYTRLVVSEPIPADWSNPSPAQRFVSQFGVHGGSMQNLHPGGKTFVNEISALDAYIYSMSSTRSEALRDKFGGSGIVIHDPHGFALGVGRRLHLEGRHLESVEVAECIYKNKVQEFTAYHEAMPPIWRVKPPEYSSEYEVRAKWSPKSESFARQRSSRISLIAHRR